MKEHGQKSAGKEIHKKNILKFFHSKTKRSREMDDPKEPEQLELFPETESEVKDIKVLDEDDGYHD